MNSTQIVRVMASFDAYEDQLLDSNCAPNEFMVQFTKDDADFVRRRKEELIKRWKQMLDQHENPGEAFDKECRTSERKVEAVFKERA